MDSGNGIAMDTIGSDGNGMGWHSEACDCQELVRSQTVSDYGKALYASVMGSLMAYGYYGYIINT